MEKCLRVRCFLVFMHLMFDYQKLLFIFAPGNFKPLLLKAMLRLKHGII